MRTHDSIGVVGAILGATLGLGPLGCGATESSPLPCDGGSCRSSGASTSASASSARSSSGGSFTGGSSSGGSSSGSSGTSASGSSGSSGPGYIACESPTPVVVAGDDTGFVQCAGNVTHRASVVDCPSALPRAGGGVCPLQNVFDSGPRGSDACMSDKDCKAHPLGLCVVPGGGPEAINCICTYGCTRDSDCASGSICACADPVGSCVPATCTSDAQCQPGSLCASNAQPPDGCPVPAEFSCQEHADECLSTNECSATMGRPACIAGESDAGARACGFAPCPAGRPFLVDAAARVASVLPRADWRLGGVTDDGPGTLDVASRVAVAAHWTSVGQMEHASIAAFARFALELLALGAPADLLVGTSAAMVDETEHARIAFELASQYGAAPIGPGPLDITGAVSTPDARSVFATLVREGCIGETLAAVEATEAHAQATAPAVKRALARIASDETSHAELAFRAARWLFDLGDDAFKAWAEAEFARALGERRSFRARTEATTCPEHGLLAAVTLEALARQALATLVEPCWRALAARTVPRSVPARQAALTPRTPA